MKEPEISVGIVNAQEIHFSLNGNFFAKGETVCGEQQVAFSEGGILWNGNLYRELTFTPQDEHASFSLYDVTIGINFHWERQETQSFMGTLKLVVDEGKITAINILPAEDYLISVISADDHCQRYQGITKASSAAVTEAVRATRGQLLMYERGICDARFSKCCGGASEEFGYCWEDKNYPYLSTIRDAEEEENRPLPDLTKEEEAERWIRTSPVSFCDTHDKKVISQILNNYDQETTDFYRWKVRYSQAELSELIRQNTKSDYGDIIDLIPIQRGKSGRICKLKIVGSLKTLTIGKELEIRRTLSSSHLFSSAFVIDKGELKNGVPEWFLLTGAGWGHGVGLCQIGAAVMGERGYTYDEILLHYYKGADIRRFY